MKKENKKYCHPGGGFNEVEDGGFLFTKHLTIPSPSDSPFQWSGTIKKSTTR